MAHPIISRARLALLILGGVLSIIASTSVAAQVAPTAVPSAPESASDRLGRYLRLLAVTPRDFQALIGAGQAALDLGDSQAAAGFFGRADEVWPTSPLPQAGIGAATALDGDGSGALVHFDRAQRLGATIATIGSDRGLAYDLIGRHSEAQADYRAALAGAQADEARRRLAVSLAVTGNKDEALAILSPLLMRRDAAAIRSRALVLALTGDMIGARAAVEYSMPGSWVRMAPFIARFGTLNSAQKVAAATLGIFPDAGGSSAASAVAAVGPTPPVADGNRLAEIDTLLRGPAPTVAAPVQPQPPIGTPQLATGIATVGAVPNALVQPPASAVRAVATSHRRFWVQVASGPNAAALPGELRKIRSRSQDLLNGISGYIAEEPGRARLLVGPFRNSNDAKIFAEDLESMRVNAFSWTSPEGQPIRKLTDE